MAETKDNRDDFVHVRIEIADVRAEALEVVEMRGTEAISKLFEFEVLAVVKNGRLDSGALIGARAALVFERAGEEIRRVHGMIAAAQDRLDTETSHTSYRLTLVPRAFRMTLHETLDIFMDQSIPEILEKLFALAGLEKHVHYELRLYEEYPKREFVVQYRETDLAFASRWMEHFGISFSFEHRDGNEVLVVTDQNVGFPAVTGGESVPFRSHGDRRDVYQLDTSAKLVPSRVMVRDYNYRTPLVPLEAMADIPEGSGGEVIEYGAHFKTPEEGAKIARIRIQETMAGRRTFSGESDVPRLGAGAWLKLEDHPWGDMDLLLTEVVHQAKQTALGSGTGQRAYSNSFKAIPRNVPFRPARVTPKPRIHGVLTGLICADNQDSRYAELDDEGRYRVKFLYDTRDAAGIQASRPLRMMQPHSGAGYGMHFPLRPGVEVLITCIDGDPDRPIIAGTVPNPQTASPVVSKNAPRNIIRTGGNNEINIDDTEDGQRIKLTTPRRGTSFQLGAPNDPIDGISAKTSGHASTSSIEGSSQWSTFSITMMSFVNLLRSGTILNIASSPNLLTLAAAGSSMFQGVVSGGLPLPKSIYDHSKSSVEQRRADLYKEEAETNRLAVQASLDAKTRKNECDLCKLKAKSKLPNPSTLTADQKTEYNALIAKIDAFDAAHATCDNDYLSAIGTLEDRNGIVDANRTNFLNDNFSPVMYRDANETVSTYDYAKFEALKTAEDLARWNALSEADQAGITQELWLAEEKKKWISTPPSDEDVAYYQAALGADFDKLDKSTIPDSVWAAAGIPKQAFATLTDAQKAKIKEAWTASQPAVDSKQVRNQRRQDVFDGLTAMLAGKDVTQEPYKSYKAYKDALQACVAKCTTELDDARNKAINTNNTYAALMETNTEKIYTLQKLSNANEQAYANHMATGINLLLAIFAFLELLTARSSLVDRWRTARNMLMGRTRQGAVDDVNHVYQGVKRWAIPLTGSIPFLPFIPGAKSIIRPHRTQVLGSDDSTEVFGKRDLLVWSETAMLLGMGTLGSLEGIRVRKDAVRARAQKVRDAMHNLQGATRAKRVLSTAVNVASEVGGVLGAMAAAVQLGVSGLPLAPDKPDPAVGKVLIAAPEIVRVLSPAHVYIQGTDLVSVISHTTVQALVENGTDTKQRSLLTLDEGELSCEVDDDDENMGARLDLKLSADKKNGIAHLYTAGGPSLKLEEETQKTVLQSTAAYSLTLDSTAQTAELLASEWKLKLEAGADKGVVLGAADAWRLIIKDKKVDLGTRAVGLLVTDKVADLWSAETIRLKAPTHIKLVSALVDFGAAAIKSDYLDVKGANDPTLTQLAAKAQQALMRATTAFVVAREAITLAEDAEELAWRTRQQVRAVRLQVDNLEDDLGL